MSPYIQAAAAARETPFGVTYAGDGLYSLTYHGQLIHKPMGRAEALAVYRAHVWLKQKVAAIAACSRPMPAGDEA